MALNPAPTVIYLQNILSLCVLSISFSEDGMEVMERLIYLFRKFHQLKISNEEYACMKAINFLNQGNDKSSSKPLFTFVVSPHATTMHCFSCRYKRIVQYLPA